MCGLNKVRVDGPVSKLPAEETAAIWRGLSHDAQLIHSASRQDDVIASKQVRPAQSVCQIWFVPLGPLCCAWSGCHALIYWWN